MNPNVGHKQIYVAKEFVIDASGSMDRVEKMPVVKVTLHQLLASGSHFAQDWVSLMSFADAPRVLMPFTPVARASKAWAAAIESLQPGGQTFMASALRAAIRGMSVARGFKKSVVLLTDGDSTEPNDQVLACIPLAVEHRIRISTIAFGDAADADLLQKLASATRGSFAHATTLIELTRAFRAA